MGTRIQSLASPTRRLSEAIRECAPKTLEEWQQYYHQTSLQECSVRR
jgi:hypothetical protein